MKLKKILSQNLAGLNKELDKITEKWVKKGCKREFLKEVREATVEGLKELIDM